MLIGIDASRVTRQRRTGTENYSLHVLREMLAQDADTAYRLYLSAPLTDGLLPLRPRTTTRLIRLPRLWTQVGLSREMLADPPDILFVPSHVLPLVTPKASVVVVYDVGHRIFPRAHGVREWLYLEWSIRRHVRVASRLVTISETSKHDLARLYGADPRRIDVVYPAVDSRFRPATPDEVARVRARYALTAPYILHLGTIKTRKNLPRLVRAFSRARLPGATELVLAGGTTVGASRVEEAIRETRTQARVRRLAYVPDADLPGLYSGAACVAIVSLYEGFGMPALEALACGAALVVGNRGSLPELADGAAVVVDPVSVGSIAEGLERITGDTPLRRQLMDKGLERAAHFSWATAARLTRRALNLAYQADAGRQLPSRGRSAAT